MTSPERWLAASAADAKARGHEAAVPVLEAFARLMHVLRAADWNDSPAGTGGPVASGSGLEHPREPRPGDVPGTTDRNRS